MKKFLSIAFMALITLCCLNLASCSKDSEGSGILDGYTYKGVLDEQDEDNTVYNYTFTFFSGKFKEVVVITTNADSETETFEGTYSVKGNKVLLHMGGKKEDVTFILSDDRSTITNDAVVLKRQ